jgi:ABC-type nickel/cobalt efflux system permease component RcnA
MGAIDVWLEQFIQGPTAIALILPIVLLLGLRHASDPDHLAAVTTLVASGEERKQVRKAGFMGVAWGLGHGTMLVVVGVPLVLLNRFVPDPLLMAVETFIGILISFLAIRLLYRWWRGLYRVHTHSSGEEPGEEPVLRHVHSQEDSVSHQHSHGIAQRGPLAAYAVGLVHGLGGSGGLVLLLLAAIEVNSTTAILLLLLYAGGTVVSMGALSAGFGLALVSRPVARNLNRVIPVLGVLSLSLGIWYGLGALGVVVYPL